MAIIFKPGRYLLNIQIKKFSHYIKGSILDIGAGKSDRYSDFFEKTKYTRLDNNPDFNPDIIADAQAIPLEDESFDSIVSTQTLEHLPEPQKAIKEFYRLLKKDGYALITVPFFNEIHDEPYDYWRFTKFSLEKIFKEAGFKIVELEQTGGFFAVLAQLLIRYIINRLNLTKKRWSVLISPFLKIFGRFMIFLDRIDKNEKNRKFAIGWIIIAKKEK